MSVVVLAEKPSVARDIARCSRRLRAGRGVSAGQGLRGDLGHRSPRPARRAPRDPTRVEALGGRGPAAAAARRGRSSSSRRDEEAVRGRRAPAQRPARRPGSCARRTRGARVSSSSATSTRPPRCREARSSDSGSRRSRRTRSARASPALKPAAELDPLADAARGRARADWLVGMNLSRAATLAHGELFSVGRVQTPTLALLVDAREEHPGLRSRGLPRGRGARFAPETGTGSEYRGTWFRGDKPHAPKPDASRPTAGEAKAIVERVALRPGRGGVGLVRDAADAAAPALRPHRAPAARQPPLRPLGASDAGRRAGALRDAQAPDLSPHRQPSPLHRCGRQPRRRRGRRAPVPIAQLLAPGTGSAAARAALRRRRQGHRPPRHHPDRRARSSREEPLAGRAEGLRPRLPATPHGLARRPRLRRHERRDDGRRASDARDRFAEQRHGGQAGGRGRRSSPRSTQATKGKGRGRGAQDLPPGLAARPRPRALSMSRPSGRRPARPTVHRRDAPHGHGDRGRDTRRPRALRGDEGAWPRNAGHAGRNHRDAAAPQVHRAAGQGPRGHGQRHSPHRRRSPAGEERGPHRGVGSRARTHSSQGGPPARLHEAHRGVRLGSRGQDSRGRGRRASAFGLDDRGRGKHGGREWRHNAGRGQRRSLRPNARERGWGAPSAGPGAGRTPDRGELDRDLEGDAPRISRPPATEVP